MSYSEERAAEKIKALEGIAEKLLVRVAEAIEKRLREDPKLEVTVKVEIDKDWPFEFAVEVLAAGSLYSSKELRKTIEEVLEEELKRAEEESREKGLEPLP